MERGWRKGSVYCWRCTPLARRTSGYSAVTSDAERHIHRGRERKRRAERYFGLRYFPRPRQAAVILVGMAGFLLSAYLSLVYYTWLSPICLVGKGCEIVESSPYATMFGVPIAMVGLLEYAAIIGVAYGWIVPTYGGLLLYLLCLTALSFSFYLFYLEALVLDVSCLYCELSYGISVALLILVLIPTPIIPGLPWKRHRLLSLGTIAAVFAVGASAYTWAKGG